MTTGLNLGGWNNNPEDPQYRTALDLEDNGVAPMQATHQELQLANGQHLSQYLSLNYNGVPGLLVGGCGFTGKAAVPAVPAGLPSQRVTLWEGHARWTPGAADLSAVYARGRSRTPRPTTSTTPVCPTRCRRSSWATTCRAPTRCGRAAATRSRPFVRWEHYDMGASLRGHRPGLHHGAHRTGVRRQAWPQPHDRVWTLGANFYVTPHVVFKADYQTFDVNNDLTRFDLGMGLDF